MKKSNSNEELIRIFETEYWEDKESNGFIPANSTLIGNWSTKDIYDLIDRDILQIRNCQGLAYELTNNYIAKLENEIVEER